MTSVTGFYIGRKMHRPGLSELETLVEHADRLPVDGMDGQAYLRCADRCNARSVCRCTSNKSLRA